MSGRKNPRFAEPGLNWEAIREDYIINNLDPMRETRYTLRAVSVKYSLDYTTVHRHSKSEDWKGELQRRAKSQADANIEMHQESFAQMEKALRERHAKYTSEVIEKAITKLRSIDAKQLTVDQMIKMLNFALPEEREARGLPRIMQAAAITPTDSERKHETPALRIARRKQERAAKKALVEALDEVAEEVLESDEASEDGAVLEDSEVLPGDGKGEDDGPDA